MLFLQFLCMISKDSTIFHCVICTLPLFQYFMIKNLVEWCVGIYENAVYFTSHFIQRNWLVPVWSQLVIKFSLFVNLNSSYICWTLLHSVIRHCTKNVLNKVKLQLSDSQKSLSISAFISYHILTLHNVLLVTFAFLQSYSAHHMTVVFIEIRTVFSYELMLRFYTCCFPVQTLMAKCFVMYFIFKNGMCEM